TRPLTLRAPIWPSDRRAHTASRSIWIDWGVCWLESPGLSRTRSLCAEVSCVEISAEAWTGLNNGRHKIAPRRSLKACAGRFAGSEARTQFCGGGAYATSYCRESRV